MWLCDVLVVFFGEWVVEFVVWLLFDVDFLWVFDGVDFV